jgi:hypothetical protein
MGISICGMFPRDDKVQVGNIRPVETIPGVGEEE